jgi:FtsZ-interacting cell division protein ZipA
MDTWLWIVIIAAAALVVLAVLAFLMSRRRRTEHLRDTFGSEYDRTVAESHRRRDAEKELLARERRHETLEVRPLSSAARTRFQEEWQMVQARFVDDPEGAVRSADGIVVRVMEERGYPTNGDVQQRAADLSVEHADVVAQYRRGHALVEGSDEADDGTESLRQAMKCFRTAFDELVDDREVATR